MTEQITLNISHNFFTDFDSDNGGAGSNQIGAGPHLGGTGSGTNLALAIADN